MAFFGKTTGIGMAAAFVLAASSAPLFAQEEEPGCRADPASPSVGADIPAVYFGPLPSTADPSLVGPVQLLTSGPLDVDAGTITLPLYRGEFPDRRNVWYVLTDTTDEGNADALGLNFASKLIFADIPGAARRGTLAENPSGTGGTDDVIIIFEQGTVDFSPERIVTPGGEGDRAFPPAVAEPGAVGDADYTPLVVVENAGQHVYNAPMISFDTTADQILCNPGECDFSRVHDRVVSIQRAEGDEPGEEAGENDLSVTLQLVPGFSFGRPVFYLSLDASQPADAALEMNTFAPGLQNIDLGNDDSAFSAVERLFTFTNGATGCDNPQRQGQSAALADGEAPFNILGGIPTIALDYSPLWDVNMGEWTEDAIMKGFRSRLIDEFQNLGFVEGGFVTGPGGTPYGSVGVIVNCPIVFRFL